MICLTKWFRSCMADRWVRLSVAMVSVVGVTLISNASAGVNEQPAAEDANLQVAKEKQTTLGLYVTAKQAYDKWKSDPEKVKIVDVRTPEEFLFVGFPTMAWKIPVVAQSYEWDAAKNQFPTKPLPDFVARVQQVAKPDDILMVMCRSGGRGALAVNLLANAGFKNAYNVVDGMEGDKVDDPESIFHGQRLRNGWKNSGCPWTYKLTPERLVLPKPKVD
jgi:rhodanese-related sulfurtransferase